MAVEVHQPTPEQLINRRLLAQDVRNQLNEHAFKPNPATYHREAYRSGCEMCAVGAVVIAGVMRESDPVVAAHKRLALEFYSGKKGLPSESGGDWHVILMHLLGFTLEEATAFETAFVGDIIYTDEEAQSWSAVREPARDWSYLSPVNYISWAQQSPLISSALHWYSASVGKEDEDDSELTSREKRLHALLDLLESWEMNPVSFPTKKD